MQQILIVVMLLVLVGSFVLLGGLVFFSDGIIRSRPESQSAQEEERSTG